MATKTNMLLNPALQTTLQNGKKKTTIKITRIREWEVLKNKRRYFDLECDDICNPIHSFYEVIRGTTRDDIIYKSGRNFAFDYKNPQSNDTTKSKVHDTVNDLVKQIIEKDI